MNTDNIILDESPEQHWNFLPVEDRVVLDLGCGINSEFTPTPFYWLNKGAKKVIGVDSSQQSYDWFKQNLNLPNFVNIMDWVDRLEKFELYLGHFKPESVKMDIEGSEVLLGSLKDEYMDSVKDIAIEYHGVACRIVSETMLKKWGFDITYYKFNQLELDFQGVIYGRKPFKPLELKKMEKNESTTSKT